MRQILNELEQAGCDIDGVLRRFLNDEALYLKYLYRFPEETSFASFLEALHSGDEERAYNELHSYKGVAGTLGLTALFDGAQALLQALRAKEPTQAAAAALQEKHAALLALICSGREREQA